ncbi:MAG: sigma-70 family RNA polymerase sigma factor [Lachnospiraceae bacterium]
MQDYEQCTDEELILRLRDGENQVTDYIMDKYKNLVRSKAGSMYILGADKDDLIQEGMIGLFKAVRDYDSGRDASFFTFAELCISRQMYSAIQAADRKKHLPLNSYISLYGSGDEANTENEKLMGELADTGMDPEALIIDRLNVEELEKRMEQELSLFEKQVLDLHITGMGYAQIAKVLGKDEKSTDNALQRTKAKIKKMIIS